MIGLLPYLKELPSQTAGPYVHIGLIPHQAGFDIFENNFSNVLAGPETQGERIRIEGRIFDGSGFAQRLITQMYFEGDPLIPHDQIIATIPDPAAIQRLVAPLDMNAALPLDSLAYRFDIVLRGSRQTWFENKVQGS